MMDPDQNEKKLLLLEKALRESESRFSAIASITADAVIMVDENQNIIFFNKGAELIFGYPSSEVIDRPLDLLMPDRFAQPHHEQIHSFGAEAAPSRFMKERKASIFGRRRDGSEFPAEASISKWKKNGQTIFTAVLRDISERIEMDQLIKNIAMGVSAETGGDFFNSLVKYLAVTLEMDFGFIGEVTGENSQKIKTIAIFARGKFLNNFEYFLADTPCETVVGKNLCVYPRDVAKLFAKDEMLAQMGIESYIGTPLSDKEGKPLGLLVVMDSKPIEPSSKMKSLMQIFAARASAELERKRSEENVHRLAYYDTLTSFPNRHLFHDLLEKGILQGQRDGRPVAVLLLDLDRFKEINDTLGHHRGDLLLQKVGLRLKEALFTNDTVARLGGDEFGILLSMASSDHAGLVANKILKTLEEPFEVEGLPVVVETSIGIALYPDHGSNADSLIQRGDVAMYASKKEKIDFVLYNSELDQHSPRRLALMGELRHAIENRQLFLHYQPIIDLRTRRICGVEALVRWNHPKHGIVPPDQFILPAEHTGLIKPLTKFVLHEAILQCLAWFRSGKIFSMAINLSVRNLQDPLLPSQMMQMIRSLGIEPALLNFEITESAIMTNIESVVKTISFLKHEGINFSIDDFGIGYTSLSYLKKLAVKSIKIDRSFIKNMLTNQEDHLIVRSTIDLAHSLNLRVIAEGVEDQETLEKLLALDCDEAQGYFISRPIPAEDLLRWTNESPWGLV
jgi:diguanylate cyclase (GGDEF)-like protein/PAS domain S-box-containing protein